MFPILFHYASLIRRDRRAVTALEYGLIAALIGVFIIGALTALGTQLTATFTSIVTSMKAA
jgi:pilus assembly protein Flp/PilA